MGGWWVVQGPSAPSFPLLPPPSPSLGPAPAPHVAISQQWQGPSRMKSSAGDFQPVHRSHWLEIQYRYLMLSIDY